MSKIYPHLWFDKEAREAAELYVSTFPNSRINHVTTLSDTPSGNADIVNFELSGQEFQAISAGPYFKLNPSISFHVKCKTKEEVDLIWQKLSQGGQVLMDLGSYPFSERYGWLQDKYGLSWQIISTGGAEVKQKITPVTMFVGKVLGKAEEAVKFWTSTFHPSSVGFIQHYGQSEAPNKEGTLKYGSFTLFDLEFGAMDSAYDHQFSFNEAISFVVKCKDQTEIDDTWGRLSAVPEAEQCGWLKDKYGLSWQIVPAAMDEMMSKGTPEQINRVTQAFLPMKKFDLDKLWKAYEGT